MVTVLIAMLFPASLERYHSSDGIPFLHLRLVIPWRPRPCSRTCRCGLLCLLLVSWLVQRRGLQEGGKDETDEDDTGSFLLSPNALASLVSATATNPLPLSSPFQPGAAEVAAARV